MMKLNKFFIFSSNKHSMRNGLACLPLFLMALLLFLGTLAQAAPAKKLFTLNGRISSALFLKDGRMVYVPVKMEKDTYLPDDEVLCVDQHGTRLWSCTIPPCRLPRGGPHLMSGGRIGLVCQREDGKRYLEIISAEGRRLSPRPLPLDFKPLLPIGDAVYGTRQEGKALKIHQILPDGQTVHTAFDRVNEDSWLLWAWPKGEGHLLHILGRMSQEDVLSRRTGPQWLIFLDQDGRQISERTAFLPDVNFLNGFNSDAALNRLGGLTALRADTRTDDTLNRFSILVFGPGAQLVSEWTYTLNASSVRPLLIDERTGGGYTVYGNGKMTEQDNSGFVFRMEVDEKGAVLSCAGKKAEGSHVVRYLNGQPYVFNAWVSWVAPFDALPSLSLKAKRTSALK